VSVSNLNLDQEKLRDEEKLSRMLLDRGVITQQEHEFVRQQARATGIDLWRVMLNLNLVSSEMLQALVSGKGPAAPTGEPLTGPAVGQVHELRVRELLAAGVKVGDAPALVDEIFQQACIARATDVHFDPQEGNVRRVRFRIDGQLHDVVQIPTTLANSVVSRIKIMAGMDIIEKRDAQDGHIVQRVGERERNLRIATIPTSLGERLVARIIDEQSAMVGMDKLGLAPGQIEAVSRLLHKPYGMIVVTGPVGSGKTTTLYSCINQINLPSRNLMTIEDPVEYRMAQVNQLQVDPRIEWTFPKALRAMLRQDPDVIMVGEVRDDETAKIAIRASLTGVLVLTSMHANDAAGTIGTLYNYGIPGYLISQSLLGVVAQRLVRIINPAAYEEFTPDEPMRKLLRLKANELPDLKLRRGRGTAADFGTGYLGRTGVFEVMEIDELIRDMIFRETTKDVIREVAIDNGMLPLAQHAINKVIEGITTVEEIYQVVLL
jgi:type II secretory ATPase GspE/PulE/Tfp pilus assembly ATPase PilB-like protein